MHDFSKKRGVLIKVFRAQKQMTQSELSELTGVSLKRISAYESGRRPVRDKVFYGLLEAIGCRMRVTLRIELNNLEMPIDLTHIILPKKEAENG